MKVGVGDTAVLSPGFTSAEVRSAPGMAHSPVVGQMTTGSVAIVLEVLGSSALEARVLLDSSVVGWVVGSCLQPARGGDDTKQETVR